MQNLISILNKRFNTFHLKKAYIFLNENDVVESITYEELDKKTRAIACYLQKNGFSGKHLLLFFPSSIEFILAFYGCLFANVIPLPWFCDSINEFEKSIFLIKKVIKNIKISGIVTSSIFYEGLRDKNDLDFMKESVSLMDVAKIAAEIGDYELSKVEHDTIAFLQLTSGSTSTPKAAVIHHENLIYNLKYTSLAWGFSKKSISLTFSSHGHIFGLVCGLLLPIYQGGTAVFMSPQTFLKDPLFWLKTISKYRITHSGCPNFGYELCLLSKDIDKASMDLTSWKVAVNGGEKVQNSTLQAFTSKFKPFGFQIKNFTPAYGMSELSGTIATNKVGKKPTILKLSNEDLKKNNIVIGNSKRPHVEIVGNGNLLPGLKVKIVDPLTLTVLPKGKIGEIWVAGKSVVSGYIESSKQDDESFNKKLSGVKEKFFRTGDMGFIRKKEIFLTGRLKEIIVRYGKKYYPRDIENTITHSLPRDRVGGTIVFSSLIKNEEQVIALVELKQSSFVDQNEIIDKIRIDVAKTHGLEINEIYFLQENSLPKTQSGKLKRIECQQLFFDKKLLLYTDEYKKTKVISSESNHRLQDDIKRLISDCFNIEIGAINLNAPLSTYHLDSIKITQFISRLNVSFDLQILPISLYEYTSFQEFIVFLQNQKFKPIISKQSEQNNWHNFREETSSSDIAIIGMNGVFPGANDLETFWGNLVEKKDVISELPKELFAEVAHEIQKEIINAGAFIDGIEEFDAAFFDMSRKEAEMTDPQQRIFLETVWKTIENAGYAITELAKQKVGLFVGVFNNDYAELLQKNGIAHAYMTTGITHSMLANRVSYLLNLKGPSEAIDTACSSSLVAVHHAVRAIQNGDCELAIAGGVNALLSATPFIAATKAGMLSIDGKCKTFDKSANGYVRAEGVGAILLKPLQKAMEHGDAIYGVIKATAVNHGGHVSSLTVPNPNAQADVIITSCQRANIDINSISYIETHGTGTQLGDPIEINGLKKAFENLAELNKKSLDTNYCGLGSVKTAIGHLEAAAGIASVIKVLLCMKNELLPGTLHFQEMNPLIEIDNSPFYLVTENKSWSKSLNRVRRAGISSFGFGGTNAHIIIEEPPLREPALKNPSSKPIIVALSAKTETALKQKMTQLLAWLNEQDDLPTLDSISFTLNVGRDHFDNRCIFVVKDTESLLLKLREIETGVEPEDFLSCTNQIKIKIQPQFEKLCKSLICEIQEQDLDLTTYRDKLLALGNFYVNGYNLDWGQLHQGEKHRISLPTYPFEKQTFWLPEKENLYTNNIFLGNHLTHEDIKRKLLDTISSLLKIDIQKITVDTTLNELGIESIALKELSLKLEKEFGIEINPSQFFSTNTIEAFAHSLHRNIPQKTISNTFNKSNSKSTFAEEPIAIVGMQAYLPGSKHLQAFWENLVSEVDLVIEVPPERWDWQNYFGDPKQDPSKTNSKWGGFISEVDKFDAEFFNISSREANLMDPQQRLLLEVVWRAIEDAGYNPLDLSSKEVGLFVGAEFNDYQTLISAEKKIFHGHLATGNSHSILANRISYFLNLVGPSEVIDTACSSALVAVHRGINALRANECEMVIAGAVSLMINPETVVITGQLGALSPDGRCKTFDKSANGYVKGEGVTAIILKRLKDAEEDGDSIYAIIRGSAVNHGGKAQSLTAPNATTQSQLLLKVYSQAKVDPTTLTYIETHGTGTELGDPIEVEGLKLAFRELLGDKKNTYSTSFCGLGSVKTNIGHLEPASGMAGMIKVLLSMNHGVLLRNLHFKELNPYIELTDSPFYIVQETKNWQRLVDQNGEEIPRRAGVSAFGFGGTCAHLLLEEYINTSFTKSENRQNHFLMTLSAKCEESLLQKAIDLYDWLNHNITSVDLEALSFTLNVGRAHFNFRVAFVISSVNDMLAALEQFINTKEVKCYIVPLNTRDYGETSTVKLLTSAGKYINKELTNLESLYTRKKRITGLPPYPFIKKRYWYDQEFVLNEPVLPSSVRQIENTEENLENFTLNYLQKIFAEKLRILPEQISPNETYEVYGIDSLLSVEISARLEKDFGSLSKTLLYEQNQLNYLAIYLLKNYRLQLQKISRESIIVEKKDNIQLEKNSDKSFIIRKDNGQSLQDIAIVGLNIHFPMSKNLREFWQNLIEGRDCISEIPIERWDYREYPIHLSDDKKFFRFGGFLEDIDKFDPLFFNISPREAMLMDPQERLFLQSAWAVLEDAGYTRESLHRTVNNEVGVFAGVTYNFYPLLIADEWSKGNRLPLDIQLFSVANRISYFLDLKGPSYVVDTACSSSLAAIHLACESIRRGECLVAVAGGVNLSLHPSKYHFLGGYSFLSDKGRCESFGIGDGYVPSEGVGTVFLKPLTLAEKDNDRIYGIIKSSVMNHGGKTSGYTVPNPKAQAALVKEALEKANLNANTISYIEAHGTGTALGDPIEIRGLQEAFEQYTNKKQFCAIGSVKSNIGHLESAAGISQLAKVLLQLQYKKLVPSIHAEQLNPYINFEDSPFYVQRNLKEWEEKDYPRRAGISSFGAGGTNIHMIVEEYTSTKNNFIFEKSFPFIFLLSAKNTERLQEYLKSIHQFISNESQSIDSKWLIDLCYTLQIGRESMTSRLAIVEENVTNLLKKIEELVNNFSTLTNTIFVKDNVSIQLQAQDKINELFKQKKYQELAKLWVNGAKINWEILYDGYKPNRLGLPTYPFAKRRCWVTPERKKTEEKFWLIFNDKKLGYHLEDKIKPSIHCFSDKSYSQFNERTFYLDPKSGNHFQEFKKFIIDQNCRIENIIYLSDFSPEIGLQDFSFLLLDLFQTISIFNIKINVWFVSRSLEEDHYNDIAVCYESLNKHMVESAAKYGICFIIFDDTLSLTDCKEIILSEVKHSDAAGNFIYYQGNKRTCRPICAPSSKLQTEREFQEDSNQKESILQKLLATMAIILELDENEIDWDEPFLNYGMDSILGIKFVAELDKEYPSILTPMDLYRYSTVNQLTTRINQCHQAVAPNKKITIETTGCMDEAAFLNEISNLTTEEMTQLLEEELKELDTLLD